MSRACRPSKRLRPFERRVERIVAERVVAGVVERVRGTARLAIAAVSLAAVSLVILLGPAVAQEPGEGELRPEAFRPEWKVGQSWEVETVNLQTQVRKDPAAALPNRPVRWKFEVEGEEAIEGRDCFRVVLRCQEPGVHPETTLWVDRQSLTLQQLRMQLPGRDGFSSVTETYRSGSGQPFASVSAHSVPPLDLPLFAAGAKGTSSFAYRVSSAPQGVKDVGELEFALAVEQQLLEPREEDLQQLLPEHFAKTVAVAPVVEVRLKAGRSEVRQLWQQGSPWPLYSTNGRTVARLVAPPPSPGEVPGTPRRTAEEPK